MNAVTQSLIHLARWVLWIIIAALVLLSAHAPWLAYVNGALLWIVLYLHVVSIPLSLNWSRQLYGPLLRGLFYFALLTMVAYAGHYSLAGISVSGQVTHSFLNALYFSATTWTTLGYGDMTASASLRLATSMEAFTGLLTITVLTASVWLYCSDRLRERPADAPDRGPTIVFRPMMGVFREAESPETVNDRAVRTAKLKLKPCAACGQQPESERYWDIVGRVIPAPRFVVACKCGEFTKPSLNAYIAAMRWNREQKRRHSGATQRPIATGNNDEGKDVPAS